MLENVNQDVAALPNVGRSCGRGFSEQHLGLARQGTLKVPENTNFTPLPD